MEMDYLIGSKKEFLEFIDLITPRDKVAVLTHTDLDGLASGIFLEEILETREIAINYLGFLEIKSDMMKEILLKLKGQGITKVFVCDIGIDTIDLEGFEEMKKEMDVFLIDHHPFDDSLEDKRNVIKTSSDDCAAMTIFFLGGGLIDEEEWRWLVCSAIFSDFSYKKQKNLEYIQSIYPDVTMDNISSSIPGINARKINSALVYYGQDKFHVYELVKERKMGELAEVHEIIEEEVNRTMEDFSIRKKYYPEKKLYFYEIDSRFNILSGVISLVSKMKPDSTFVFMQKRGDFIRFSARNQGNTQDVGLLMKKCVEGLEGASGGGHRAAAAARIQDQDLHIFMKKLLS